eukprot:COSAG01_NODE_770_length_13726_cov_66.211639_6_plen_129_part_00
MVLASSFFIENGVLDDFLVQVLSRSVVSRASTLDRAPPVLAFFDAEDSDSPNTVAEIEVGKFDVGATKKSRTDNERVLRMDGKGSSQRSIFKWVSYLMSDMQLRSIENKALHYIRFYGSAHCTDLFGR